MLWPTSITQLDPTNDLEFELAGFGWNSAGAMEASSTDTGATYISSSRAMGQTSILDASDNYLLSYGCCTANRNLANKVFNTTDDAEDEFGYVFTMPDNLAGSIIGARFFSNLDGANQQRVIIRSGALGDTVEVNSGPYDGFEFDVADNMADVAFAPVAFTGGEKFWVGIRGDGGAGQDAWSMAFDCGTSARRQGSVYFRDITGYSANNGGNPTETTTIVYTNVWLDIEWDDQSGGGGGSILGGGSLNGGLL